MTDKLLKNLKEMFSWAQAQLPRGSELELFANQGHGRSVIWSEKKCEDMSQAEGGGVGVRVILRDGSAGKQGFAFTTSFHRESIEKTAQRALDVARLLPADPFRRIPAVDGKATSTSADPLVDSSILSETVPQIQERLKQGENELLKKYPLLKSLLRAGFSEGLSQTAIVNSGGVETSFSGSHCGLGVSFLAEKDGERQEGGFGFSKRFKKDLDWNYIFEKAAQRTMALLGGKPVPSGNVPVIFDPSVACEFVSLLSGAVCADNIQKGKSFLAGKLGNQVATDKISVVDDGTLSKGIATSPVDDEGVPTQKTEVIANGKLKAYLYDTYTALKDQTTTTGNAVRAGYRSSPNPGTSNFYLNQGKTPPQKLLAETRGLYLYEAMGLHMADPISGDFSVGVMGAWVENGESKFGVRGVTLAGNLLKMLQEIDTVCDDLTFFGSVGSPTFRVRLAVSGTSS